MSCEGAEYQLWIKNCPELDGAIFSICFLCPTITLTFFLFPCLRLSIFSLSILLFYPFLFDGVEHQAQMRPEPLT
jgi:hypothetical protein